jgi:diguanylate cyclase (GGDEF)-like protein
MNSHRKPSARAMRSRSRISRASCPSFAIAILCMLAASVAGAKTPMRLDVEPPPWATAKAYAIYALGSALVISALIAGLRRKREREEQYTRRLEEDVISRTRELAARNAELERMNQKLEAASLSDPLTGLGNRRSLGHAMPGLISRIKLGAQQGEARSREHMIMMLVDLDRLKPVNDEHGHEAGDRLLAAVSAILLDCVRATDQVVRWGGDEFVIVAAPMRFDDAAVLAERIRATVARRHFAIARSKLARTSCSIGFASYPFVADDPYLLSWEQTLSIADMALYRAKARRNAWIGWTGTHKAAGAIDLPGLIAMSPADALSGGLIEARACVATDDQMVERLLNRKCS